MSCPSRNTAANWNPNANSTFNPNSVSTPRNVTQPMNYQGTVRPQRLFQSGTNLSAPAGFFNPANYPPEYFPSPPSQRQYTPRPKQSPLGPGLQGVPGHSYLPQNGPMPQQTPITSASRKQMYATQNVGQGQSFMAFQSPMAGVVPHDSMPRQYPQNSYWNNTQASGNLQSRYTQSNQYRNKNVGSGMEDYPSFSGGSTPKTKKNSFHKGPRSSSPSPDVPEKMCPSSCSSSSGKLEKLYTDYVNAVSDTVASAIVRRKRIRGAVELAAKFKQDELDCRERRAQEKAINQMESNFRAEIVAIYNELMNKRKQLHHEVNHGKNSRGSLVSINAPTHKNSTFGSGADQSEIPEEDKEVAEEFTKIVIDAINDFSAKDIELTDELSRLTETDCDCNTMNAYQEEYLKVSEQMEEEFISTWEEYESNKCKCSSDDEEDELMIEIGAALQEILAKQFKMCEELEKKLREECGASSQSSKSFHHSDRMELSNVHVDIMNDLWYATDAVRQLMEERPSTGSSENYSSIFRALLAIYRKCLSHVKQMLDAHYETRRAHQVENLSSIFLDEWTRLRRETNEELKAIIDTITYSTTNMNCQEKRLKKLQDGERAEVVQKYKTSQGARPCKSKDFEEDLNEELAELDRTHGEQWDNILMNKMQKKVDEIERIYPKESKEACVQTCSNKKKAKQMKRVSEDDEGQTCECKSGKQDERKSRSAERSGRDGEPVKCSKSRSSHIPDLKELTDIEVKEMKELQKNLRQWQLARRNLLESINRELKH